VHVALDTLVHSLVDLVDEGEGGLGEFGERHEVHDGGEGTLLCKGKRRNKEEKVSECLTREDVGERDSLLQTGDAR